MCCAGSEGSLCGELAGREALLWPRATMSDHTAVPPLTWPCPAAPPSHDAQKQRAEEELAKAQAEADRVKREKLEQKEERRRKSLESQKMGQGE